MKKHGAVTEVYAFNNYRYKKMRGKYFVTTEDGSWAMLDKSDFGKMQKQKVEGKLFNLLENEGIIITKRNQDEIIRRTKQKYSFLSYGPSLHIVVVTLRCNMKCSYCQANSVPADAKGFDMDQKTAKKTVDFIFQSSSDCLTIEFQGGEPLLNFETVKYIIKYAKKLNIKHKKRLLFTIVTNLNAIDDTKLGYLLDNNVSICTSLDGPKMVHDCNRPLGKNSGSYDNVIRWSNKIGDGYKKINSVHRKQALITITKKALKYPEEIVDEYIKNGFEMIFLRYLTTLGSASSNWDDIGYTPEEFMAFWRQAIDYIIKINKNKIVIKERKVLLILQKLMSLPEGNQFADLRSPCGAAIGQLLYNHDGSIFICDEGRMVGNDIFKIGTVDDSFPAVLTSNKTCAIISASVNDCFICDDCVYKPYCGLCPVCNYFEQGNIIAKIPETSRCKIYMAMFDYIVDKYFFDKAARKVFDRWLGEKI
jgi:uncharacterized protein